MTKNMKFKERIKGKQLINVLREMIPEDPEEVFRKCKHDNIEELIQMFHEKQFIVEITVNQVTEE